MMTAYLNEKNGLDGRDIGPEVNLRKSKLADAFIAPTYRERYRVLPNTAQLNTKGSRPEQLICLERRGGQSIAVTAIANRESGWTSIMQYRLTEEGGRTYILPSRAPTAAVRRQISFGNDPTTWIDPMTEIDGLPRAKN